MIYIAFDQATSKTGYAIYEDMELIESGVIAVKGIPTERLSEMIKKIEYKLSITQKLFEKQQIKVILEDIQYQEKVKNNVLTFKTLARLQGGLIFMLYDKFSIEPVITPSVTWKSFAGVKGSNRKQQKASAQKIVTAKFGVEATEDESDAILLGMNTAHQEINW